MDGSTSPSIENSLPSGGPSGSLQFPIAVTYSTTGLLDLLVAHGLRDKVYVVKRQLMMTDGTFWGVLCNLPGHVCMSPFHVCRIIPELLPLTWRRHRSNSRKLDRYQPFLFVQFFKVELREQDDFMLNKADSDIFFNESTNDSIKIIMCNNRDFGGINEKSYLHYVSCAIMYSIFSCFMRAMLD